MITVLLTGATGFVGHHMLEHFLSNTDYNVVCLIRNAGAKLQYVLGQHLARNKRIQLVYELPIDCKIDYVVHCAANAQVADTLKNPLKAVDDNVIFTAGLLDYVKNNCQHLRRFVYLSSGEVYGPNKTAYSWTEQDKLDCRSPYSATKAAGEMLVSAWAQSYNIPSVILRPQNIYGPRQLSTKFFSLVIRAVQSGQTVTLHGDQQGRTDQRAWLHVSDCVSAVDLLLDYPLDHIIDTFNLGGDLEQPLLDTAQYIGKLLGKDLIYDVKSANRPGHGSRYTVNNEKIRSIGFRPKYTGTLGIEQFTYWTAEHTEWLTT
jgi:nucleoside-diphosphate-sugar epimerase